MTCSNKSKDLADTKVSEKKGLLKPYLVITLVAITLGMASFYQYKINRGMEKKIGFLEMVLDEQKKLFNKRLDESWRDLDALREDLRSGGKTIDQPVPEIASLEKELKRRKEEITSVGIDVKATQSMLEHLKTDIERISKEISDQGSQLKAINDNITKLLQTSASQSEQVLKIESDIKILKEAIKRLDAVTSEHSRILEKLGLKVKPLPREKIALFPFKNFSEERNALMQVTPILRDRLERMGFEVVDQAALNGFLLKERIRSTTYVIGETAHKVGEKLGAKAILLGSINTFFSEKDPQVGLSTRLVDTSSGSILWANHASAAGTDFRTFLGLGTIRSVGRLTSVVVDKLLASLTMAPPYREPESIYKIAVMPFQNKSRRIYAGMIVSYIFMVELFKSQNFKVVEYGEVRRLVVESRIRHKGELDYDNIQALGEALGVDGILVGTVEQYTEGAGTSPPEVAIHARLLDTNNNVIVWSDQHSVNGDDHIIIFELGKIRSADKLAHKAISRLVGKMERVKWHRKIQDTGYK